MFGNYKAFAKPSIMQNPWKLENSIVVISEP